MMLSSSVDVPSPGGMSVASGRNVIRSSSISGTMYSLEKSPSSTGTDTGGNKKRRSSLGAKMVAIVGLSQWSKSTQQLNQQGKTALSSLVRGLWTKEDFQVCSGLNSTQSGSFLLNSPFIYVFFLNTFL